MKNWVLFIFVIILSINTFSEHLSQTYETCPEFDSIHPSDYMGLTIYRTNKYMSRWVYPANLTINRFIRAEASTKQLQDCWYEATDPQNKLVLLTLSPIFSIKANLEDPNWLKKGSYHYCESKNIYDCLLHPGRK